MGYNVLPLAHMETTSTSGQGFYGLGIAPNILTILEKLNFKTPTPYPGEIDPGRDRGKGRLWVSRRPAPGRRWPLAFH